MDTITTGREQVAVEAPAERGTGPKSRLFAFIAVFAIVLGAGR